MLEHLLAHSDFYPFEARQLGGVCVFVEDGGTNQGKPRQVKSCLGVLKLKSQQTQRLGLRSHSQLSPLLEKCCLRLSANESYQNAEAAPFGPDWGES